MEDNTSLRTGHAARPAPEAPALLPCPFCGGAISLRDQCCEQNDQWFIWCETCLAEGPPEYNESDAIAAWNRRASAAGDAGLDGKTGLTQASAASAHQSPSPSAALREALEGLVNEACCSDYDDPDALKVFQAAYDKARAALAQPKEQT